MSLSFMRVKGLSPCHLLGHTDFRLVYLPCMIMFTVQCTFFMKYFLAFFKLTQFLA